MTTPNRRSVIRDIMRLSRSTDISQIKKEEETTPQGKVSTGKFHFIFAMHHGPIRWRIGHIFIILNARHVGRLVEVNYFFSVF